MMRLALVMAVSAVALVACVEDDESGAGSKPGPTCYRAGEPRESCRTIDCGGGISCESCSLCPTYVQCSRVSDDGDGCWDGGELTLCKTTCPSSRDVNCPRATMCY